MFKLFIKNHFLFKIYRSVNKCKIIIFSSTLQVKIEVMKCVILLGISLVYWKILKYYKGNKKKPMLLHKSVEIIRPMYYYSHVVYSYS